MIEKCLQSDFDEAYKSMNHLWRLGYTAEDILSVIMRVTKTYQMSEFIQLEFIRVLKLFLFFFKFIFISFLGNWSYLYAC
jgi:replication factor C subunit 2/4